MKKLLKMFLIAVLSIFCAGFAQAHYRHNSNFSFNISGPGYGFSINNNPYGSGFYYDQRPVIFLQSAPTMMPFQSIDSTVCSGNLYFDADQFGNQISPIYKICWRVDQFGNQISPLYRQF